MGLIKKIQDMKYEMTRWRQKLHEEPELAFDERSTARYISRQLISFGINVHNISKTGVMGVLHGKDGPATMTGGKTIMLRADMDALPMKDETGAAYASKNPSAHHGSGHDGHMAMLLGAAKHLAQNKNFVGTVYFVFQPGETEAGAKQLIDGGLFDKFPCDEVYGLQSHPDLALGTMVTGPGALLATAEEFHITLSGQGSHPSQPGKAADIVGAAAELTVAIGITADSEIAEDANALLAVTSIHTKGNTGSSLPDSAVVQGNIRTQDQALHDKLHDKLEELAQTMADKYGVKLKVEFKNALPALVNSNAETAVATDAAKDIVGDGKVSAAVPRALDADDFSYFLQEKPGNMMLIGTGKVSDGRPTPELHSSKYDFNDAALPIGASYWVSLVEKVLAKPITTPQPPAPKAPDAPKP